MTTLTTCKQGDNVGASHEEPAATKKHHALHRYLHHVTGLTPLLAHDHEGLSVPISPGKVFRIMARPRFALVSGEQMIHLGTVERVDPRDAWHLGERVVDCDDLVDAMLDGDGNVKPVIGAKGAPYPKLHSCSERVVGNGQERSEELVIVASCPREPRRATPQLEMPKLLQYCRGYPRVEYAFSYGFNDAAAPLVGVCRIVHVRKHICVQKDGHDARYRCRSPERRAPPTSSSNWASSRASSSSGGGRVTVRRSWRW